MNPILTCAVSWFQILNLFMVLLLSTFSRDSVLAPSEKTCTLQVALGQIKSAAARSKTWILEHICPSQGTDLEHTGRTRTEPDHSKIWRKDFL